MQVPEFTVEQLKQLPLRAMVAFAVRCARRVEHMAQLPDDSPARESHRAAIDAGLRMAEQFAGTPDARVEVSVVERMGAIAAVSGGTALNRSALASAAAAAHTAACACHMLEIRKDEQYRPALTEEPFAAKVILGFEHVEADLAALDAYSAASEAFACIGYNNEDFVSAGVRDFERLLSLKLGKFPEPGLPINPTADGPLGRI
jgi:hypothetical protein